MIAKLIRRTLGRTAVQQWPPCIFVEQHVELYGCMLHGPMWVGYRSYANDSMIRPGSTIGRYCSIGRRVTVGAAKHSLSRLTSHNFSYYLECFPAQPADHGELLQTTIGNDVWVGDNVVILGGRSIGDGAVIGAGAVVTKDVPPYTIVAGVPARTIRLRFDAHTIDELLNLRWWEYGDDILKGVDFSDIRITIDQVISRRAGFKPLVPHHAELGVQP